MRIARYTSCLDHAQDLTLQRVVSSLSQTFGSSISLNCRELPAHRLNQAFRSMWEIVQRARKVNLKVKLEHIKPLAAGFVSGTATLRTSWLSHRLIEIADMQYSMHSSFFGRPLHKRASTAGISTERRSSHVTSANQFGQLSRYRRRETLDTPHASTATSEIRTLKCFSLRIVSWRPSCIIGVR